MEEASHMFMEKVGAMLMVWLLHAIIAGILSAPIVILGRKRVHWHLWELLTFIIPFALWTALFFSELSTGRKSLANFGEPNYFALAIPLAALVRVAVGSRVSQRVCAIALIGVLSGLAVGIFFIVPSLPE